MDKADQVGRYPQYDRFADEFLDHARDGFFNAHYDRPACLELLGDVTGKTVLDAACGPRPVRGRARAPWCSSRRPGHQPADDRDLPEPGRRGGERWHKGWEVTYWLAPKPASARSAPMMAAYEPRAARISPGMPTAAYQESSAMPRTLVVRQIDGQVN
jgi:hypothetical protein